MKEIHAYLNEDGTYRVEGIGRAMESGELKDVVFNIPRAKVTVDALLEISSGELYSVIVEDD